VVTKKIHRPCKNRDQIAHFIVGVRFIAEPDKIGQSVDPGWLVFRSDAVPSNVSRPRKKVAPLETRLLFCIVPGENTA
jgi:hypothetical protein